MFNRLLPAGLALAGVAALAAPVSADIGYSYFQVQSNGRDFGPMICCAVSNDEVLATLSAAGLPVYNPAPTQGPVLQDHDPLTGELLWFTPSLPTSTLYVQATSTGVISGNTFSDYNFYPPDGVGGSDAGGFMTAVFSGAFTFSSAQTFSFTIAADDDALLFVDGTAKLILGGIHGATTITQDVPLSAGTHTFKLFYADRQQTGAALAFSIPDDVIVTSPPAAVPEPATWAMMIGGFGLVGAALRRRRAIGVRFA